MRLRNYILILPLAFAPVRSRAQTPPPVPAGGLMQLQVQQAPVDVSSPVSAAATFDPPVVRAGEKVFYRVNIDASEAAIAWPTELAVPEELKFGDSVRGQILQVLPGRARPLTAVVYEVQTQATGKFTVTNFNLNVDGQIIEVPAATLTVVTQDSRPEPQRRLRLETSATNLFLGQPFCVRVSLATGPGNQVEALREIRLNDEGLMTDKTVVRQAVAMVNQNGQPKSTFISELMVTPITVGARRFTAQAFTAGRDFSGPITLTGQVVLPGGEPPKYVLMVTEPLEIHVQPLPVESELPGFTGAMGKYFFDPPQLATNQLRVGEPVHLTLAFHSENELSRFVPPTAPPARDWQIIADKPPATGFTLIPLTDEVQTTPVIPFSTFDPATGKYLKLTIPSLPVTVSSEGLPVQATDFSGETKNNVRLRLSDLATTPGKTVTSLQPLQRQGWFVGLQLLPALGLLALWQWDRRRRFLEAHPEILRRRKARRALRHKRRQLQAAAKAGDSPAFVQHAAEALRIAVAPHFPANPQALVCRDVLAQLEPTEQTGRAGETVRKIFAGADAQFAYAPSSPADLLAGQSELGAVLAKLEAKL